MPSQDATSIPMDLLRETDAAINGLEDAVRLFRLYPFPRAASRQVRFLEIPRERNDDYVRKFLPPLLNGHGELACAGCGATLGGMIGSFTWGLAHGEGRCFCCGWPARALHYFGRGDDEEPTEVVLQYHPDEIDFWRTGAA